MTLSTTPVYANGRLEPRPVSLRVYLVRTPQGWTVMPGGFARVGLRPTRPRIAMQRGGHGRRRLGGSQRPVADRDAAARPSARALRARSPGHAAEPGGRQPLSGSAATSSAPKASCACCAPITSASPRPSDPEPPLLADFADYLEHARHRRRGGDPAGLIATLDRAVVSAGKIRDRFSTDGWLALSDLSKTVHKIRRARWRRATTPPARWGCILRKLAGFSGLLHENMYHFTGWRFLEIGRRLERAIDIAAPAGSLARKAAPDGALDMMVEIGDSVMTHRRRYAVQSGRRTVVDLLALDTLNPRSVLFQLERLKEEIGLLPGRRQRRYAVAGRQGDTAPAHDDSPYARHGDLEPEALDAIAGEVAASTTSSPRPTCA